MHTPHRSKVDEVIRSDTERKGVERYREKYRGMKIAGEEKTEEAKTKGTVEHVQENNQSTHKTKGRGKESATDDRGGQG